MIRFTSKSVHSPETEKDNFMVSESEKLRVIGRRGLGKGVAVISVVDSIKQSVDLIFSKVELVLVRLSRSI